nr:MAG TPA: hypothetical protein [Caudoviricetes sp.]
MVWLSITMYKELLIINYILSKLFYLTYSTLYTISFLCKSRYISGVYIYLTSNIIYSSLIRYNLSLYTVSFLI